MLKTKDISRERAFFRFIVLGFVLYTLFFSFISFLRFETFSFKDFDLTMLTQTFDSALRGRFFRAGYGDFVIFSGHIPLMILLLSGIYALFSHPLTLLFLQSAFLASGVFAVYLIAGEVLDSDFALCFSFAYLLYPALHYINLYEAHMVAFSIPLLLFMFYFFLKDNFRFFVLFMFLALFCQEDVALAVMGFGVYAGALSLIKRDKKYLKWAGVSFPAGAIWITASLLLITYLHKQEQAHLTPARLQWTYSGFYSWLGGTPLEAGRTLITRPGYVLANLTASFKLKYIAALFAPLGFLSLFGLKELIIVFFGLSESLFSSWRFHSSIYFHYSSMVIPFIFISAIFGTKKVSGLIKEKKVLIVFLCLVFIVSSFLIGPLKDLSLQVPYMIGEMSSVRVRIKNDFIKKVPPDAALITTFELSSHLTGRRWLFPFYLFTNKQLRGFIPAAEERAEYALVDFDDPYTFKSFFYDYREALTKGCFLFQDDWGAVETLGPLVIFKKGHSSDYKIIESRGVLDEGALADMGSGAMKVLSCDFAETKVGDFAALNLGCRIVKLRDDSAGRLPVARISNSRGQVVYSVLTAPFRIYPFEAWKKAEVFQIRSKIYLPGEFERSGVEVEILEELPLSFRRPFLFI